MSHAAAPKKGFERVPQGKRRAGFQKVETLIVGDELARIEAQVDAWRAAIPVPPWSRPRARWNLLSVIDDLQRLRTIALKGGSLDAGQYNVWIDTYKFMLKYALEHVDKLVDEPLRKRPPLDQEEWGAAHEILKAHQDYDNAVAAFSGAWAGTVRCLRQEDGSYWFRNAGTFERQANDVLESRSAAAMPPVAVVVRYLGENDDDLPPALRECTRRVRASDTDVRPRVTDRTIAELDEILGPRRVVIPEQWTCTLGSGKQIARTFRNLWLVAIAHVVALTNGAAKGSGLNLRWLLGEVSTEWLARSMSMNSGVDPDAARDLVRLLSYGHATRNPDPALQFLFPLRDRLIAVPWFLYLTSNAERNFLALLARVRKRDFDGASAWFERAMIEDVRNLAGRRRWTSRLGRMIPGETAAGEVDVVLIDANDRVILVCELRWFLEPSEVREVAEREAAGADKARQAETKRAAVRRTLSAILREEGIVDAGDWTVEAVAVFDNYLPTPLAGVDIPFVSHRAFLSGIAKFEQLRDLVQWIRESAWLPRGEHFTVERVRSEFGGIHLAIDGLNPTEEGEQFIHERDDAVLRLWGVL